MATRVKASSGVMLKIAMGIWKAIIGYREIRPDRSMTVVHSEIGETRDEGLARYKAENGEDSISPAGVAIVSHVSPGEVP